MIYHPVSTYFRGTHETRLHWTLRQAQASRLSIRYDWPEDSRGMATRGNKTPNTQAPSPSRCMLDILQWHHNGRDGVSNHQTHDCILNRLFMSRAKKASKLRVTGLWGGEFTGDRWIPRTNGQCRGKCFHLMTSSCKAMLLYNQWKRYKQSHWQSSMPWVQYGQCLIQSCLSALAWIRFRAGSMSIHKNSFNSTIGIASKSVLCMWKLTTHTLFGCCKHHLPSNFSFCK